MEMPAWTTHQKNHLKAIWGTMTATQIMRDPIFQGRSRSAICGAAKRFGLTRTVKHYDVDPRNHPRPRPNPESITMPRPAAKPKPPRITVAVATPAAVVVASDAPVHPCTMLDLDATTCRWPIWHAVTDHVEFYCGATPLDGLPYCAHHSRIAYHHQREENAA
jgi:GcrA cell cycle regulator